MTTPSRSEFGVEAGEILDALGRDLLKLETPGEADPDVVNGVFRAAHSLKGLAGLFGQDAISELAHQLEDVLDLLRLGKTRRTGKLMDALNEALELLQRMVDDSMGREEGVPSSATVERAQGLATRLAALAVPSPQKPERDPLDRLDLAPSTRAVLSEYEEHRLREGLRKGLLVYRVSVVFNFNDFDERLGELAARLKPHAELISTLPSSLPGDGANIGFDLLVVSGAGEDTLKPLCAEFAAQLDVIGARKKRRLSRRAGEEGTAFWGADEPTESGTDPGHRAGPMVHTRDDSSLRSFTQTVRVDIKSLDELMNAVGDLLLIKNNLAKLVDVAQTPTDDRRGNLQLARALTLETRALERRLGELQKGLLAARMVPLSQLFDKLSRLVRKTAREAGKELEFVTEGGQVELDKLIVEELSDPLMHIIRNALDHGIEAPEVRRDKGKPERGRVTLAAWQRGSHVIMEVRDDGAGINLRRVREVAIQRGVLAAGKAKELSERDLQNLLFLPGFSTANRISTLSGRGVGLDVVKTNIARLSGIIDLDSSVDEGTTFRLTLPATLAILRALVIQVSQRVYAVPLGSVLEILSISPHDIRTVEGQEMLSVRHQTLPLVRLAELFGHEPTHPARPFVVVVGLAAERMGIVVDEVLGQQDIVTKPLGGRLRNVRGLSGATDLGNRRTVLVLDVAALLEDSLRSTDLLPSAAL